MKQLRQEGLNNASIIHKSKRRLIYVVSDLISVFHIINAHIHISVPLPSRYMTRFHENTR